MVSLTCEPSQIRSAVPMVLLTNRELRIRSQAVPKRTVNRVLAASVPGRNFGDRYRGRFHLLEERT